jgi:PKD repeat protein
MALVTSYYWDFGDGYSSNLEIPVHNWLRAGVYTVTLTVWTDFGSVTVTGTVTVEAPVAIAITAFCLRFAVEAAQGVGWSECSGDDWIQPVPNCQPLKIIDDNDTPRMLIEDRNDDKIWEDATFDRVEFQAPAFIDKYYEDDLVAAEYRWVLSAGGTNEYYVEKVAGGDPVLEEPKNVEIGTMVTPSGVLGALLPGYWGWGDNDALGFNTVYVRLPDNTDPDTKNLGYVVGFFWTEITWEEWFLEEVSNPGGKEDNFEVPVQHFFTRPKEANNKGKAGYDSNGYRIAQQFDLDVYKDGELTRPFASVTDTPENGDILFSGYVINGKRIMPVFKGAASEVMLVGRNMDKIIKPRQDERDLRRTDSWDSEVDFSAKRFHIGRNLLSPLLERVGGSVIAGSVGQTIGPDGIDGSAIIINVNLDLTNIAVAGVYTFTFWRNTNAPVATAPALPALTQQGSTFGNWQLMYVAGNNCPANVIITPGTVSEIVIYTGDVTAWLGKYYEDVRYKEEPKQFLVGF